MEIQQWEKELAVVLGKPINQQVIIDFFREVLERELNKQSEEYEKLIAKISK